jgi:NCS1 family nucleobase:cation symporter-1
VKHDSSLYNADLAPISKCNRKWGAFEIFNVWANDVQSLFGYTLAASLFLTSGLSGWAVFGAILLAGIFVMTLVNLVGKPSVQYGIPFPVFARVSMGVRGANFPALVRAIVAIFWFGAQTYFASTAVSLLLNSLLVTSGDDILLGMTAIDWLSFLFVWSFQLWLFWNGIDWIRKFLNWTGPLVYILMIALAIAICSKAGGSLWLDLGTILKGNEIDGAGWLSAFFAVFGTMVAYFAAVVVNFGDFSRFVESEGQMRKGNLWGLPGNLALFSLTAIVITAGTVSVFGEALTNPTDIVSRVNSLGLTIIAAFVFCFATVGINLVANFIPPVYDLANLAPDKINFRRGGLITSSLAFIIGGLWVSLISEIGIINFVNTLGAILAPVYGIMMADYYLIKNGKLDISQLFSTSPAGIYYYYGGWNRKAILALTLAAIFSIAAVWLPSLEYLSGFSWIIGAALGATLYYLIMKVG